MEFSFSSGNYYDTEDSFSEDSLNPTLPDGYVPCEDTISCEDTTFQEEITFNVDFSVQLLLTNEHRGGMESESSLINRQGQIQDNPEPVFMQSNALPWDEHDGMLPNEDYIVQSLLNNLHNYLQNLNDEENQTDDNENQTDGNESKREDNENEKDEQIQEDKVDDSVFPEPSDGRDFQPGSHSPLHVAQISHREHSTCQDLPKCKPLENKDVDQFPEITPMLKGQNLKKVVNQAMGNKKASSTETCWTSSVHPEEKDTSSSTEITHCVNFRRTFHWIRKQVCCCIRRRRNSKQTTQSPCEWAPENRCPVTSKLIQQEEFFQ